MPDRWPRPIAKPKPCAMDRTPLRIGRCSMRCSTPRRARPGSPFTTAAASASDMRSMPGMVVVADGTEACARRLERVLTTDPGMGVIRHVDAGYPKAIDVAHERGIRIPMDPETLVRTAVTNCAQLVTLAGAAGPRTGARDARSRHHRRWRHADRRRPHRSGWNTRAKSSHASLSMIRSSTPASAS